MIINRRLDLLARNPIADALYSDFADTANLARMTFLDPAGRVFFTDWEQAAEACVAHLRMAGSVAERLVVYRAAPDSADADAVRLLGMLGAVSR
ncbi:hypothetical protein [Actinoplanes sp. G11-F43]|uniref:MmyB family transcriptional regulator n=1 Tax=Actinoplanes sp. G11-F43 TaxID=3424130 RepID=UPI003D3582A0